MGRPRPTQPDFLKQPNAQKRLAGKSELFIAHARDEKNSLPKEDHEVIVEHTNNEIDRIKSKSTKPVT